MAENQNNQVNSDPIAEAKCPNCGGSLVYDAEKGTLKCAFCGSNIDLGYWQDHSISGFDFRDAESNVIQQDAEDIPVYNCVSCGAEVLAAKEEVSLTCPYCKNNIVLTDKVSGKLRPNAIIPFKVTKDKLEPALKEFYKDKRLLPKDFFSQSSLGKVTGVYVPFWVFSGTVSGDLSYTGEKISVSRSKDFETTVVSEYKLLRDVAVPFKDLTIDASEKFDDAMMDSVSPFDLSEAKDFNMAYLAGYAADRFDVASENLSERADHRMKNTAYKVVHAKAGSGYSNVRFRGGQLKAAMDEVRYMLFPIYSFSIDYNGTKYRFAMNGQTGKVVGEVPTSKQVSRVYKYSRALIVAAIIMLISWAGYMMGV